MSRKMPPVTPGEILFEEFMEPYHINMNQLAKALDVPVTRIYAIIHEQRRITADTALRLARFFGTTPRYWLNLQMIYDLELAEISKGNWIIKSIEPFKQVNED